MKSFHILWAGIWVTDCHLLALRCHPLLGKSHLVSAFWTRVFPRCRGTVKAERSAFIPRQLRALPTPFSLLVYTWILPRHHLLRFRRKELNTRSFGSRVDAVTCWQPDVESCAVDKLLLILVHKNVAWAFRSCKTTCLFTLTFQISEKLGGHVGLSQHPQWPLLLLQGRAHCSSPDSQDVEGPQFVLTSACSQKWSSSGVSHGLALRRPHPASRMALFRHSWRVQKGPHHLLDPTQGKKK